MSAAGGAGKPATAAPAAEAEYDYGEYGADEGEAGADGGVDSDMAELEAMLAEAEETQAKIEETADEAKQAASAAIAAKQEEEEAKRARDERSVFVGNVDWSTSADELTSFFQTCGAIERTTILMDKFNQPKGFAYIEFADKDSVANALILNDHVWKDRKLKVVPKRTNVPAAQLGRGRGRGGPMRGGRGRGRGGFMPMMVPPFFPAAGMFYMPRGAWRGGPRGGGRGGPRGGRGRGS